jgi:hypothetical protein
MPSSLPSQAPTSQPSKGPSSQPSSYPSSLPSSIPTYMPTAKPHGHPTTMPSSQPSSKPTKAPTSQPLSQPTSQPSAMPTFYPTSQPTSRLAVAMEVIQIFYGCSAVQYNSSMLTYNRTVVTTALHVMNGLNSGDFTVKSVISGLPSPSSSSSSSWRRLSGHRQLQGHNVDDMHAMQSPLVSSAITTVTYLVVSSNPCVSYNALETELIASIKDNAFAKQLTLTAAVNNAVGLINATTTIYNITNLAPFLVPQPCPTYAPSANTATASKLNTSAIVGGNAQIMPA